jgi:hypothetical protein
VQRSHRLGALVEHRGPLQRALGVDRLPGVDLAFALFDALEAGFDQVDGLQPLVGHALDGLAGRILVRRFRHAFFPLTLG